MADQEDSVAKARSSIQKMRSYRSKTMKQYNLMVEYKYLKAHAPPGETAGGGFSRNAYPQAARRLITTLRIARVVCRVNVM